MICSRRARDPFLFAATVSRRKGLRSLLSSCWPTQIDAPRASPRPHRAAPAFRAQSRSTRSWLLLPPQLSRLSRSLLLRASHRGLLDRWTNHDIAAIRSRHRAANQYYLLGFAHLHHLEVLHSHALVAHVTRHAHVL